MNTTVRNYSIRLSAEGKRQLEADLRSLGKNGERSLKMIEGAARPATAGLKATNRASKDLKGGLRSLSGEIPALQRLGRLLGTTALAGGLAAFGRSSIDVAGQFEASMKRVEAATRAPVEVLERLRNAARDTGATTAFTAREAADAIEVLAKNGLDAEAILGGALKATVNLAGGLGAELAPAGDLVTDVMQQFRLEASELPAVADAIAGAALTSKFSFDDLRLAIGQAGGVVGSFGGDYQEFLTALSATASGFASGSDAGTSFKNFLQRLNPQSKEAATAMRELGLEFYNTDGSMKSMLEITGELEEGVKGLSDSARNSAFQSIFGTDAIRTALLLADTGAAGFQELAEALGQVSAEDQAEVRLQGLQGALREVNAAWEALQLTAADSGGLELAEDATRRLTEALRYLSENFEEVEEIAERVAQALIVYLVGRGVTLAVAKAVAMRAAYIELAGAVTGVGTAAQRGLAPISRLGAAARLLTGVLGGPLSLAITAASLAAFFVDIDRTSDALDAAESAANEGARALDAYREASRRAAEEQKTLGGEVSEATRKMLEQSRAQLQQALTDAQLAYNEARGLLSGRAFDSSGIDDFARQLSTQGRLRGDDRSSLEAVLFRTDEQNDFMISISETARALEAGKIDARAFLAEFDQLRAIGSDLETVRDVLLDAVDSGAALAGDEVLGRMVDIARETGLFADELARVDAATNEQDLAAAFFDLINAITEAAEAGKLLRSEGLSGFRENIEQLADTEAAVDELNDALQGNLDLSEEIDGSRPFDSTEESATEAAAAVKKLISAHGEYVRTRQASVAVSETGEGIIKALSGTTDGREATAVLLRRLESFIPTPEWDVNALRIGYGSDTITLPDGSSKEVVEGMRISVEEANRDLYRRIGEFQSTVVRQIGSDRFSSFTAAQQAALNSIAYNYGSLPKRILDEVRGGTNADIAEAIRGLGGDNKGINRGRRNTEAAIFSRIIGVGAQEEAFIKDAEEAERKAKEAAAELTAERAEQAETLQRLLEIGDDQIAQLELEASLAGKSAGEQARLRFMFEQLTAAKKAGIDPEKQLTQDGRLLIDVYREQADALAARTAAQEQSKQATEKSAEDLEASKDAVRSAFDNLKPGGEGAMAAIDEIASYITGRLWELAFDPVWETLGGLLDDLFSGLAAGFGTPAPAVEVAAPGNANGGSIPGYAGGGGFPMVRRAAGQLTGAGGKRQDNHLFWGSAGEFMQPAASVDYYGPAFMEAVRQRRFPKFADGGGLGRSVRDGMSGGGASSFGIGKFVIENHGAPIEAEAPRMDGNGDFRLVIRESVRAELRAGSYQREFREAYGLSKTPKRRT
ncbi:Phage-related minor tail protein [Roseivivax sp. THAF40]|uniref:phage tail tape measure protein n=1 Tax=Roseivivax sp. THAF40 TaxID=2587858 RepID=UPI00126888CC|nr:Phage-related minor tail protein [Roseivivax sp. THAF40]